ncbi:MAG: DNA-3-methyladenine glycosylase [Desulfurella sp.]|uniref:DNA-3-methyladenine glycosylase n=1 Tax=Desulfurella sp. TaxID=1962857 RepID=UPI003C9C3B2F
MNIYEMLNIEALKTLSLGKLEILEESFFTRSNLLLICEELLGKVLLTNKTEGLSGGLISEVEAYFGSVDLASHAYKNKRTKRNEPLFKSGGILYIHTCHGHTMLNVVTNRENIPQGILIRGIIPLIGIDLMKQRRGSVKEVDLANGPGKLTKALGITMYYNTKKVYRDTTDNYMSEICIANIGIKLEQCMIEKTPRIGIDYAKQWLNQPLRFSLLI